MIMNITDEQLKLHSTWMPRSCECQKYYLRSTNPHHISKATVVQKISFVLRFKVGQDTWIVRPWGSCFRRKTTFAVIRTANATESQPHQSLSYTRREVRTEESCTNRNTVRIHALPRFRIPGPNHGQVQWFERRVQNLTVASLVTVGNNVRQKMRVKIVRNTRVKRYTMYILKVLLWHVFVFKFSDLNKWLPIWNCFQVGLKAVKHSHFWISARTVVSTLLIYITTLSWLASSQTDYTFLQIKNVWQRDLSRGKFREYRPGWVLEFEWDRLGQSSRGMGFGWRLCCSRKCTRSRGLCWRWGNWFLGWSVDLLNHDDLSTITLSVRAYISHPCNHPLIRYRNYTNRREQRQM